MPPFFDDKKGRERRTVLLVEGKDDASFFDHMFLHLGSDATVVGVSEISGKDKLAANILALSKSRPFLNGTVENVGVIIDADSNPAAALSNVHQSLNSVGWGTPQHGNFAGASPRVGIFVLPSFGATGDLEQLCLDTIPDDPRKVSAELYFNGADAQFGPFNHQSKRRAAIFLTLVHEETRGVGRAFTQGVFNENHPSLDSLKDFLQQLVV